MERGHVEEHSMACAFHPETASGIVIRSQRDTILSYNDLGAQVRDLHSRQDEMLRRIDELSSTAGRRGDRDAVIGDNRTMQDLDAGFEEVHQNLTHLEARQSMWTLNQVMPIREEVTELRNNINMIRMHVNWLLNRSREEGRLRAANSSAAATTLRHDAAGATGIPTERRRSSGAEADVPRL
jgi:ubiquitin conjugation factor E4 B